MKQIFRAFLFLILFASASNAMMADEKANVVRQGTVRGRIVDASKQTLPGASIYIEKLHAGVTSDVNGFYTFTNLDPGTYTVKVSYVGYSPVELKITIPEGKTLEKDVVLQEGVELQEVVVGGAFQGQRRAINSQKSNFGITNVVSADQVGKFPDSNIGDALKRISGINVQYDQGEARFGQVRGTSADLSSVTINGNRIPSAEGDTRNVQLDLIPADMVQTIEVNKVVTPDMDADAIGGSINLVTKSSPYRRFISATAGSGYNWVSEKAQLNLGFTYGDRFFNNKLGVMVSASYQNSPSGSDDIEFEWDTTEDGDLTITDYQIRQYYVTRERQSYSASLDYEFNKNHKLTFKGIFNNRNDWENRYRLNIKDYEDGVGTVRVQTKGGTPDNRNARLERQRTMDFTLGGEHLFGKLNMDWSVNYAKATEYRPNERYIDYQLKKQKFDLDITDQRHPLLTPQDGYTMTLDDSFGLKEVTEQQEDIQEKDFKAKLDFKLPLKKGAYGNTLRFGAKLVHKTKDKVIDFYEYTPLDEDGFDANSIAAATQHIRSGYMPGKQYIVGNYINKDYLGNLDLNNSSLFEKEQVPSELAENYNAKETVTAGYIRWDQKLGKKWNLMLGLRLENTHVKYSGSQYTVEDDEDETETVTRTPYQSDNYINVLPSVLAKWDVNDDFKVRASFTNTISRPKYSNLAPNVSINRGDNEISIGNPELKPTISYNFDLSGEYYFKSVGLVSAGIFYKKIDDFIVDQTLRDYEYNGTTYKEFSQPRNSGNANLLGVELSYQRDFGFIAPALKCIGFYGTYTYSYSRVENFNFEGREDEKGLRMPGSPEHTANASLFFEKWGASLRLSYNYASSFIDEMGSSAFYDRYYDAVNYMDLNAGYTFGKNYKCTIYAEATNLLNQPLRYYQGSKDRTMQSEHYGVRVNAGVKIQF
ncbi:MAG: TonB-dependent receptor [Bacteroides sp.]|nr:TonB-dependent receptor [Bacteroides sp.]